MRIGIISFQVRGKTYKFKEPLMLESENAEGRLCLTHKELSLSACGKSWSECEQCIRKKLAMMWEAYALASDNGLTMTGAAIKKKLLAMVEGAK